MLGFVLRRMADELADVFPARGMSVPPSPVLFCLTPDCAFGFLNLSQSGERPDL
jgi:hypothetical protein